MGRVSTMDDGEKYITNTAKPPMIVWLQNQQSLDIDQWQDYDVTWCRDKIFKHDVGPYVHLDKFLAEVEAVADSKHHVDMRNYGNDFMDAVRELSKEIKEGK